MTHAEQFEARLFTELPFQQRKLIPLRRLYRQMRRECLGEGMSFRESPGLHANMSWHYATSALALDVFRCCLTGSQLNESLTIVHGDSELLAACFVVVQGDTPVQDYHMDYGEKEIPSGVTGTMLTPLLEFHGDFGHLEYRDGHEEAEYRYQLGDAILFDGKFEHRSQASISNSEATRVLVSWSIATSDERYSFAIRRVIDSQTK